MNERIFELSIQAKREFDEQVAECEQLGTQIEWVTEERLVELVVQECAEVLLKWKNEPFPFDEELAASLIKEHFGLK